MLKPLVPNRAIKEFHFVEDPDLISDYCADTGSLAWVDVSDPTGQDFAELAHPLSIDDCRSPHQRPKVEEYSGYISSFDCVVYGADASEVSKD